MKGWKTKRGGREKVWEGKGRGEGGRRYGKEKGGRRLQGMEDSWREKFRRKVKNGGAKIREREVGGRLQGMG